LPNKEIIKKEAANLLILFVVAVIILQIVFFKENMITTIRAAAALFWLFVLPGYALMLYWRERLSFLERAITGMLLGAAIIGVFGYNLGVFGVNVTAQVILLPTVCLIIGGLIIYKKKQGNK
jgi:uncharacterized membrane protein